jgi:hypothetical protein
VLVDEAGAGGVAQQHAQALAGPPLRPPLLQVVLLGLVLGRDAQLPQVWVVHQVGLQAREAPTIKAKQSKT